MFPSPHQPVFFQVIEKLVTEHRPRRAIDCTAGYGGHTSLFLQTGTSTLALDRDPQAIEFLQQRFGKELATGQLTVLPTTFGQYWTEVNAGLEFDFILFDLGISSLQVDAPERGFSFSKTAPLDMRMDPRDQDGITAFQIVQEWSESAIADLLYHKADERLSRAIAREIVAARASKPIATTTALADIASRVYRRKNLKPNHHPATKTFLALRLEVNQELEQLTSALERAANALAPGGILAVISFHSIKDRIVKQSFQTLVHPLRDIARDLPIQGDIVTSFEFMKKVPRHPTDEEISENPRARSAQLRVLCRKG